MTSCLLFVIFALVPISAVAQPVIAEPGWTLLRTIDATNPVSARFNSRDNRIYFGQRGSGADGLYQIDSFGFRVRLATGSNVSAIAVQPDSGHVFISEDYSGVIYRTAFGTTGRQTWVSGFRSGDDDACGISFAPADYTGDVLLPGEALSADRGYQGFDDIWRWSTLIAQGEVLVHTDNGTLIDAVDVAIGQETVYVVDTGETGPGKIYTLAGDGTLTVLNTTTPLVSPAGIAIDPLTGDLLVLDQGSASVVRVDTLTGVVSSVMTGLSVGGVKWAGVDISADGHQLLVTDTVANAIYVFALCDASQAPELDCNGNGIYDLCEIAQGDVADCNRNGIPDDCDLLSGVSQDCNLDGLPDDCPDCVPVEVVFVMDTSTSMDDEAAAICNNMALIVSYLEAAGVQVLPTLYGICNQPGGAYSCLEGNVITALGTTVPGTPPVGLEQLGACPGGNEVCSEDWGLATAVVAGSFPWLPASNSIRLIIPLSDEGAWCGDPVTQMDNDAITHAISIAQQNNVIVSPITGTGASASVIGLAQSLATATGGLRFSSTNSANDIAFAIADLVLDACASEGDCDGNGVIDDCEITGQPSLDFNDDGILDVCQTGVSGVGTQSVPQAGPQLLGNVPNPFNPRTTLAFYLPVEQVAKLTIYGLDGRLVRTLVNGVQAAGTHEAVWNGRDATGKSVASGVYFYRLEAEGFGSTRRMVLVK